MTSPIKLLMAIPHLGGGGAEKVAAHLARGFDPRQFEVHLVVIAQDFPGAEAPPPWVSVHRLDCNRVRRAWLPLLRLIGKLQPDAILSGMAHLNFLFLLLRPLLPHSTRLLVRQNTTASAAVTTWLVRTLYRRLYPLADRVICQSKAMADDLEDRFGIPRGKLAVLANPLEPARAVNSPSVWPDGTWPRLLAVGRLAPEKGIDLLLHAIARMQPSFPRMFAIVLGTGPEEPRLRKLSREWKLESALRFAGHRVCPATFYSGATLFVQPSRYEGMPNALLEAAAAGLPLVSTPSSGGVCELLANAPGAWLAAETTAESLAEAMQTAFASLAGPQTQPPRRFEHAFLAPFEAQTAIAAYAALIESVVRQDRD